MIDSYSRTLLIRECATILASISFVQERLWTQGLDEAMINVRAVLDELLGEL